VDVADLVAPTVTAVSPLPATGGNTSAVIDKLTVTVSEDLDASTINVNNRMVWSYGGHFYLITDSSQTWASAEAQAVTWGGHLATVNDAAEQQWLFQTFGRFGDVWVGLTDQAAEGTWAWISGQAASYTNWASGQPGSNASYDWARMSGASASACANGSPPVNVTPSRPRCAAISLNRLSTVRLKPARGFHVWRLKQPGQWMGQPWTQIAARRPGPSASVMGRNR
jgi:hypothetical protein